VSDILARIARALEGVTPGPWEKVRAHDDEEWLVRYPNGEDASLLREPDADFISAARTLLPECATELAELRAQVRAMVETMSEIKSDREELVQLRAELKVARDTAVQWVRDASCSDDEAAEIGEAIDKAHAALTSRERDSQCICSGYRNPACMGTPCRYATTPPQAKETKT
jgi:hypothetical protein